MNESHFCNITISSNHSSKKLEWSIPRSKAEKVIKLILKRDFIPVDKKGAASLESFLYEENYA